MDLAVILAAAEHAAKPHRSEAPFFVAGPALAAFAILISVFGFKRPDFPATASAARGVMAAGALLVAAAVSSAVYVAL
ncbi:MAG: hypothetical protein QOJ63_1357 [Solirubrobacteraceae bacterium]|jgi:hypothetical protein|nr:hypothetical protein [Solirubrobacteraceae bacterium]